MYATVLPDALQKFEIRPTAYGYVIPPTSWRHPRTGSLQGRGNEPHTHMKLTFIAKWLKAIKRCDTMGISTDNAVKTLGQKFTTLPESTAKSAFPDMVFPFVVGLCQYLGQIGATRSATPVERTFITQMIEAYLTICVKRAPQRPTDWRRTNRSPTHWLTTSLMTSNRRCPCSDCDSLQKFLSDPHKRMQDFQMHEGRRRQLETQLDSTFNTTTIEDEIPHTLRIEKTEKEYENKYNKWKQDAETAKRRLLSLARESPSLVRVIGEQTYQRLLEHECFQDPQATAAGSSTSTIPQKQSFVDLT